LYGDNIKRLENILNQLNLIANGPKQNGAEEDAVTE